MDQSRAGRVGMRNFAASLRIAVPALLLALPLAGQTQTNKLTNARPYGPVPGGYVGPYQAQIVSQPGMPYIDVYCVDYVNHITVGATWTTTVSYLNGDLTNTRFQDRLKYRQAAWLSLQFKTTAKSQWASIHGALWNITSPGAPSIAGDAAAQAYLLAAQDANNYNQIDLSQWMVLTDVNTAPGAALGGKQEYLTQVAPEPATMILLGTGLAGMAAARRRRRNGIGDAELG